MIRITEMYWASLAVKDKECVTYGKVLTPTEEHQICHKILKMLMQLGINAQVSTNAELGKSDVIN
jgi:hypothetical protein